RQRPQHIAVPPRRNHKVWGWRQWMRAAARDQCPDAGRTSPAGIVVGHAGEAAVTARGLTPALREARLADVEDTEEGRPPVTAPGGARPRNRARGGARRCGGA